MKANMSRMYQRILGVQFYKGDARGAIESIQGGGLLVAPAAPSLKDLTAPSEYRDALLEADVAIADSALMVLTWNLLQRDCIRRLSGLEYLQHLLELKEVREPGNTVWVMAGPREAKRNLQWLASTGIVVPNDCVYQAPLYGEQIMDLALLELINQIRPRHIIITIGGGSQERLGLYLKRNLQVLPAIHCIGAAIAFLSGDQVRIPNWADRFYLGWFFRCVWRPLRYVPRYWSARHLIPLLIRYRDELPTD